MDMTGARRLVVSAVGAMFLCGAVVGCDSATGNSDTSSTDQATSADALSATTPQGSDEDQIQEVIELSVLALQKQDSRLFYATQCAAKRSAIPSSRTEVDVLLATIQLRQVTDVTVDGDAASAKMLVEYTNQPGEPITNDVTLRKEAGAWLIC